MSGRRYASVSENDPRRVSTLGQPRRTERRLPRGKGVLVAASLRTIAAYRAQKRAAEPETPADSCLAVDQGLGEFGHDVDESHGGKRLGGEGYEL